MTGAAGRTAHEPVDVDADTGDVRLPLRLLRVVEAVARRGGSAAAASELHLSPSAVSRAVLRAEGLLGLPLFDRGARGMVATPAGALLVLRVARLLDELRAGAGPAFAQRVSDGMLRAYSAAARAGSESAAASRLGITQPAVHALLRDFEHAARRPLLERTRRGTRLREAGVQLLPHVRRALAEWRSAHDELAVFRGRASGQVSVGALPMTSEVLVPQALTRLFAADPQARARVVDGTYEALLGQLRQGELDFMVGPLRGERCAADVAEDRLFVDRLLPVVRQGHPLLAGRAPRTLAALQRWPWIGPLPDTPARQAFERAFVAARLPPPPVRLQANSPPILRAVLLGSDAVAMVSPLQVRAELASGALVCLPVMVQGTERAIGVTRRRGGMDSPAARALLAHLQVVAAQTPEPPAPAATQRRS